MKVRLAETVLVLSAETMNEAAIVGQIRQVLRDASDDNEYVTRFGMPDFDMTPDSPTDKCSASNLHVTICVHANRPGEGKGNA